MDIPAEYQWIVPVIATVVAVILAVKGYFTNKPPAQSGGISPEMRVLGMSWAERDAMLQATTGIRDLAAGLSRIEEAIDRNTDAVERDTKEAGRLREVLSEIRELRSDQRRRGEPFD